jgi:hypothetical protein
MNKNVPGIGRWTQNISAETKMDLIFVRPCVTRTTMLTTNKMQHTPFIDLLNHPYMFRATNSPILRSTFDCIYSSWYNALTLLLTDDTVEMNLVRSINGICCILLVVYIVDKNGYSK